MSNCLLLAHVKVTPVIYYFYQNYLKIIMRYGKSDCFVLSLIAKWIFDLKTFGNYLR